MSMLMRALVTSDIEDRVHEKIMLYGLPEAILHLSEDERKYYERYVEDVVYPKG